MGHQLIPCADCDEARHRLEERGYTVHACVPEPGGSPMCRLEFEWIEAGTGPTPAATARQVPPDGPPQQGAAR